MYILQPSHQLEPSTKMNNIEGVNNINPISAAQEIFPIYLEIEIGGESGQLYTFTLKTLLLTITI